MDCVSRIQKRKLSEINSYPRIFGTITERNFRENPKHGNKDKMMQRYALERNK